MTIFRRNSIVCLILAALVALSGCGPESGPQYQKYGSVGLKKVGIVLASPGKSTVGLNEAVTAGIQSAAKDLDIEYKILAPKDLADDRESLSFFAENLYDMVVAVGAGMAADLVNIAPQYPDVKFVIIDGEVDEPNVASVKILEDEGAFLAGVQAASMTKTNLVGYVGEPAAAVKSIENSFVRGVQYVNSTDGKQVKVNISYTGVTDKAAKAAELAQSAADNLYKGGVDVIFSAGNSVNQGVVNAAVQNRKISICNDIQLMNATPSNEYGAIQKKEDSAIYDLARQMADGKLTTDRHDFGLAQSALDFIPGPAVPADVSARINTVKAQLKTGQVKPLAISIPDGIVIVVEQE
ncbi:MAG: BMP family ABC transporter substrate-binding protein [Thermincola sp.]|jgi:basic membrane protein A|nr:BMP family ABC transporter substrate-binding protein [Thermincola sp.]MDT3701689.1 BMP family ABC transporter substrate-binding protein [Thermincola sp.]